MIVIGADTHKSTHTLAAVDAATGRVVATRTVGADRDGMLAALALGARLDGERVWAIEDCRHVSGRLERCLIGQGERVVRVAPKLMGQARRGERRPGKSDEIDAIAVARAALQEGVETLPVAFLDERGVRDPAAVRSPRRSGRRAHPPSEPAALASGRARRRAGGRAARARWTAMLA